MSTANWGWMLGLLALMSAGCVVETGSSELAGAGEAAEEPAAQTSDALVGGWAVPYAANTPVATHLCVLTEISGRFAAADFVELTQSGDFWLLRRSGSVTPKAYCFPRNLFKSNNADTVISPELTVKKTGDTSQALALGGYAFTFLTGQKGTQGLPAYANVVQSKSLTNSSLVQLIKGFPDDTVFGRSFQAGTGAAHLARFVRADGTQGDVSAVSPFELPAQPGPLRVVLAPTAKAVCTFTSLRSLVGEASLFIRPELLDGIEKWVLTTQVRNTSVSQVRCFARDQTL